MVLYIRQHCQQALLGDSSTACLLLLCFGDTAWLRCQLGCFSQLHCLIALLGGIIVALLIGTDSWCRCSSVMEALLNCPHWRHCSPEHHGAGNTKGGSITVPLTSCLTGLDQPVLQIKTKIVSSHTADSKPVKQEVNGTVIHPPLVFPARWHCCVSLHIGSNRYVF